VMDPVVLARPAEPARGEGADGQDPQRDRHRRRRLVEVMLLVMRAAEFAPEGEKHRAEHVEGGERRGDQSHRVEHPLAVRRRGVQDLVLAEEAGEGEDAGDRQRADHKRVERLRQGFAEPAHLPHVLLAAHRVDHRAGPQEEERLEERVRSEMEDRRRIGAEPGGQEHVAELRDGGVGEHLLDVRLRQADRRREDRRRRADHRHELRDPRRELIDHVRPHHHVDARRHHGRGVDEGGHRRRTGHRVRQPDVERNLRALAHRADEEAERHEARQGETGHRGTCHQTRIGGNLREDRAVLERIELGDQREHAEQEGEVADPVDDERLLAGVGWERLVVVEADQQVGAEAHALPAHEHDQVVAAEDQHQHRRHEQVQIGEVAPVPLLVRHVAGRVDVDQEAHECHHEQHHRRERVQAEAGVDVQRPGGPDVIDPLERLRRIAVPEFPEAAEGDEQGEERRADVDRGHQRLGRLAAEASVQNGAGERQDGDQPEKIEHVVSTGRLPTHQVDAVQVDRVPLAEDGDEQGEPHGGFGGGDREDEEDDELSRAHVEQARVGDQRQVGRVQHQLDRQEDADAVAPGERAHGADHEQGGGEQQVPVNGNGHGSKPSGGLLLGP